MSPSAIWISLILYLAAGGPHRLGGAVCPLRIPLSGDLREAEVCPIRCRTGCHVALGGVSGCWAHKVEPLATEIFLSGPKGPNLLDSRIAKEGKHSGYRSSDVVVVQ